MGEFQDIIYEAENGTVVVTFNRPAVMNALGRTLVSELDQLVTELERDSQIRAVIFTGGEKVFSPGVDLKERKSMTDDQKWWHSRQLARTVTRIAKLPQVTIAAINGYCLGGGLELALGCDLRVAGEGAQLGLPETRIGILPGAGGTQRLSRLIGAGRAKLFILTARRVPAREAEAMGLVEVVVPTGQALAESHKLAMEILQNSPLGVGFAKKAVDYGLQCDLSTGLEYEETVAKICFYSNDYKEGLAAFNEKRKANFQGR